MANPVLSERVFGNSRVQTATEVMTIKGTTLKSFLLLLVIIAAGSYTWKIFHQAIDPTSITPWMWGGLIGGFITAMIISFSPKTAPFLAPVYALLEGLFLGAISAAYNGVFAEIAPNIVINAILMTLLTALLMLTVFRSGIIKIDNKFMRVITLALSTILFYYLILIVLSLFGVNTTLMTGSTPLSIGISIVIVAVAAFSLLVDYQFIVSASEAGAPKYMEWYGAFGLMVTIVWLYLEILRLLAKFAGNRNN